MKRNAVCFFTLLLVFSLCGPSSAQMGERLPIVKFITDYYAAFENGRIDGTLDQYDILDFFTDDAVLFVHPNFGYAADLDESAYYTEPVDCSLPGISCGIEILDEIITPFVGAFPGMVHDVKDKIFRPIGNNVWQIWVFYDYKAPVLDVNGNPTGDIFINFPGVSIYTVDLTERREDGGRGRVTVGRLIYDNYKFLSQLGLVP